MRDGQTLLASVKRIADSVTQASHLDQIFATIASEACHLSRASRCYVVICNHDEPKYAYRGLASINSSDSLEGAEPPPQDSLIIQALRTGRALNSSAVNPAHLRNLFSPFAHTVSQIVLPMVASEREEPISLGVLVAEGDAMGQLTADADYILQTITSHGAIAIVHAQILLDVSSTYDEILRELRTMPEARLVRNVLHDAKNLVRDASGTVELIQSELAASPFGKKRAAEMNTSLDSLRDISDLLSDMLTRLRRDEVRESDGKDAIVDLVALAKHIQRLFRSSMGVDIAVSLADKRLHYLAFGGHATLLTVVYNLTANSVAPIKSSGKTGKVTIALSDTPAKHVGLRRIEITDSGPA